MPLYNCAGGNGGGGGGTSDYSQLSNLPQINNTTLLGNKSASDLGLVGAVTGKGLSTNDYTNADKAIVDGVTSALAGKADVSSVPTKTSDLTNDSGFITNLVNNLFNYYLKSETYSKTEVDALLQAITTLDIQAVQTLPTTNISTTTIYLVPKQDPQVPDVKDEYINLDGTTSGWELIGNTQIDLSNYVTTSDLTTALQSYATKAYVDGLTFVGTQAQWNALTTEQKKAYKFADITDDYDDNPVGNLNALTTTDKSSCVAAINEIVDRIETETITGSGTTDRYGMIVTQINADRFINARVTLDAAGGNLMYNISTFSSTGKLVLVVINSTNFSLITNTNVYYKILAHKEV